MLERISRRFDRSMIAIMIIGVLVRLGHLAVLPTPGDAAEAENVANAIAAGRGMADAFFPGSGPTAHLTPTMPAIAGLVQAVFGIRTLMSAIVLETLVLCMIFAALWLLAHAMVKMGVPRIAALASALVFAVIPLFIRFETFYFRYWEGALAVFLQSLVIWALAQSPLATSRRWIQLLLAVVPALLAMVLPPLGIAAGCMIGLCLLWERQWRLAARLAAGMALATALIFVPWTLRNQSVMHRPIFLRSNLGLELAVGANPAVADVGSFVDNTIAVHPFQDGPGRRAYRAEGELAYFDRLQSDTRAYIAAHPGEYARTLLRHARQFLMPDTFEFGLVDGGHPHARALLVGAISLSGIIGFLYGAWFIDRRLLLPVIQVAVLTACYLPFQPISRYLYANYALLLFGTGLIAVVAIRAAVSAVAARAVPAPSHPVDR